MSENSIAAWNILTEHIKNKKDCNSRNSKCFGKTYYNLKGEILSNSADWEQNNKLTLPDGTSIWGGLNWILIVYDYKNGYWPAGNIYVDLNGSKGPNVYGKDYFQFYLTKGKGIVPCGAQIYPDDNTWGIGMQTGHGSCFTGWVLQNENMDYLKCKDFTKFTWSHPSCD